MTRNVSIHRVLFLATAFALGLFSLAALLDGNRGYALVSLSTSLVMTAVGELYEHLTTTGVRNHVK